MRSSRSNVHRSPPSLFELWREAAPSDVQTRMATATARSDFMKSRAPFDSLLRTSLRAGVVIVILLGAFSKPGAQGTTFTPVTDAMLLNPDPADWPNWRRT